jgi:hypothetical protein
MEVAPSELAALPLALVADPLVLVVVLSALALLLAEKLT